MVEDNSSANPDWLRAQQQYWDAWLDISRQALNASVTAPLSGEMSTSAWVEVLEQYWKGLVPLLPNKEIHPVLERFVDQGKNFFYFNNELIKTLQNLSKTEVGSVDWNRIWDLGFNDLKESFSSLMKKGAFLDMPFAENWQKIVTSDIVTDKIEHFLSIPGLGYTREWQQKFQKVTQLALEYQRAQQHYLALFNKMGTRTIELLQNKFLTLSEDKKTVDNLRIIYDLWIECAEEAYAECVNTQEYSEASANQLNTLMSWKAQEKALIDEILATLNMPTRKELDTVNCRMQQMRREAKIMQSSQENNMIVRDLREEMSILRAELELLKNQAKKPVSKKTATKKTPPAETKPSTPPLEQPKVVDSVEKSAKPTKKKNSGKKTTSTPDPDSNTSASSPAPVDPPPTNESSLPETKPHSGKQGE